MSSCPKCGSTRLDAEGCPNCRGLRRDAADAHQTALKIDPRRLDDAPEVDLPLDPQGWGRGSDAPPPRHTAVTRQARRSPRDAAAAVDRDAALRLDPSSTSGSHRLGARPDDRQLGAGPNGSNDHDDGGGEVVPIRRESDAASATTTRRATPSSQQRPPVLASVALRRDLTPAAPAPALLRISAVVLGMLGLAGCLGISRMSGLGAVLGGAFAGVTLMGALPMSYPSRAAAVVTLCGGALTLVTWGSMQRSAATDHYTLLGGVILLSTALLFRAWHRASLLARALTLLGIAICAGWLWMARGMTTLMVLDTHWQAWLPPVMQVPFALVLMLSLLALMDSRSTGGCGAWAALLLGWYALHGWTQLLSRYFPEGARELDLSRVDAQLASAHFAQPLMVALLAIALAQTLAVTSSGEKS